MAVPASLKAIKPYIDRGAELAGKDPMVAYHLRLFALNEAMKIRSSIPKGDMGYVITLMDELEKEKAGLGDLEDAAVQVENFGQDLFQKADDADRAGRSDLKTGKAFLAASNVLESCKQFGELPADLSEKIKYAKWRFVEIAKATKEGRPPVPPRGNDDGGDGALPPAEGPSDYAAPPPPGQGELPSYMGLPMPPAAPLDPTPPVPSAPSSFRAPAVPAAPVSWGAAAPPPAYPGPAAGSIAIPPSPPGFKPDRPQILSALRLCQTAVSSLQFQDIDTAVPSLIQALQLLTQPQAPEVPP